MGSVDGETFLGDKRENVVGRPQLDFTMNKIPTQFETLKPKNWLPSFVTKSSAKLTRPLTSSYVVIHPYRISSWLNHHFVCNNVDNWQLLNEFSRCTSGTIFPRRFLFFRYRWEGFVTVVSAPQLNANCQFFLSFTNSVINSYRSVFSPGFNVNFFFASQLLIVKTFEDGGDGDSLKVNKNVWKTMTQKRITTQ